MRIFYLALFTSLVLSMTAQQPPSFFYPNLEEVTSYAGEQFDQERLMDDAIRVEQEEGRTMNGVLHFVDLNMIDAATFNELNDGTKVWRMRFHSDGAQAVCVYFDDFHLPVGSEFYIYNSEKTYFEGPLGYEENNEHGRFLTNDIFGEDIIIEYVQPAGVIGRPSLGVMAIGHVFRYAYPPAEYDGDRGGAQPCEVDVNCPEIDGWEEQRDAVVRLRITDGGAQYLCSGAMVNNTSLDCRQLLLTALHCADGVATDDLAFLQVRFNYERPADADCGTGSFSSSHYRTGVYWLADSNDNGAGGFQGSDFLLLEVEDNIPDAWTPYFAGWDASGSGSTSGVGIHHPSGDIKKVSTYSSNLQSVWLGAPGSHWQVTWVETETDHGVTEGGSSGSPIFNSQGLIIGTLSAGLSACTNGGAGGGTGPNEPDYYGKMSYHWDFNPNSASDKLHNWLEPYGVGIKVCPGTYRPCSDATVNVDEQGVDDFIHIAPNPSDGLFFIRVSEKDVVRAELYDHTGKLVFTHPLAGPVTRVDAQELPAGAYILVIYTTDGQSFNQQMVKF